MLALAAIVMTALAVILTTSIEAERQATIAEMVVTGHAVSGHTKDAWSPLAIRSHLAGFYQNRGGCSRFALYYCPLWRGDIPGSPSYGKPSPQIQAFCELDPQTGAGLKVVYGLGIGFKAPAQFVDLVSLLASGLLEPAYVTGYASNWTAFHKRARGGGCVGVIGGDAESIFGFLK